ncbi:MAG: preprotein translocase subunit SecG [Chloroflexi bacterium]|nr:preprotein translocase subunit SecG [Chloroflexota bacterium]
MILTLLSIIVYISSIALIGLVTAQTTKSDGISGVMGGGSGGPSNRYMPGSEEILQNYTTYCAIIWMASCLLWFVASTRR